MLLANSHDKFWAVVSTRLLSKLRARLLLLHRGTYTWAELYINESALFSLELVRCQLCFFLNQFQLYGN
jgi:hypothetical protein